MRRSPISSLDEYKAVFRQLEETEREFVQAAPAFRDPQYIWGTEILHTWSRAWEYAYVYEHLRRACGGAAAPPVIADFGSGSTFFTFAVARLPASVICFDNDPIAVRDLSAAAGVLSAGRGAIDVRLNAETLPLEGETADAAFSLSVLEHIPEPASMVAELARILKPGGTFALTFDLDVEVSGGVGVPLTQYEKLRAALEERFEWVFPERITHPLDMLTSKNSPWPVPGERKVAGLLWRDRSGGLHPLAGGPSPGVLTVYGAVLRKRI